MKILYVITKGNWGGAQRYVFELSSVARDAGHQVTVAYGEPGFLEKKLKEIKIPTHPITSLQRNINPFKEIATFFSLIRLIRDLRPDVIHLSSSKIGGLGALAGRVCGVRRIIFTVHGWPFNEDRPWVDNFLRACLQWVTVFLTHTTIVVAEHDLRQVAHWPFVQHKIVCIHNGVFGISFLDKMAARKALLPNASDALWIGAHTETINKGGDFLLQAYARIRERFGDALIAFIGTGSADQDLKKLARELGVADSVHFLGFVEDFRSLLKAFDIYVVPSRKEGLPYSLLEAGAARLPVIASHVGGIPEVIDDTRNGYLAAPGDITLLSARLKELGTSQELREKLGTALKEKVEKDFGLQKMLEKTLALYH